jgi:hypothetical protein
MTKQPSERDRSGSYGIDRDYIGAFPSGIPLIDAKVAREILRDPEAAAAEIAHLLRERIKRTQTL